MNRSELQLLLVEDDEEDYLITRSLLAEVERCRYVVTWCKTYQDGLSAIRSKPFDVCLIDYRLGELTGLDFLNECASLAVHVPMILLTGQGDDDIDIVAMQAGAADYLNKTEITASLLARSIRYALERNRTLLSLQHSEKFFRSTLDALTKRIAILDETGVILATNDAWNRSAPGWSTGIPDGSNYLAALSALVQAGDESANRILAIIRAAIAGATPAAYLEYEVPDEDEPAYFALRVTRFRIAGMLRIVVAHENITRQKAAEEAVRVSERSLARAQEIAKVGSWDLNLATGKTQSSDEARRIFGCTAESTPTTEDDWSAMIHDEDREAVMEVVASARQQHTSFSIEHRIVRPSGEIRVVNCRGEHQFNAAGKPVRILGTVQDVTERCSLEDQLRQSQRMEAVGRLAGGVAHDFNNLLTVIIGYSNAAGQAFAPDDPIRRKLDAIRRAGDRAAALTQQLLALSRKQVLQRKALNLNDVIRNLEGILESMVGEDVYVSLSLAPDLGHIRADPGRIEQVILNLIVNARDAMPGGGTVTISTRNALPGETDGLNLEGASTTGFAVLEVRDTGIGMTDEVRARIFEPFFTTKEIGRGTGLGLPTAYGIIQQSGGTIELTSAVGRGTTFRVYLPHSEERPESSAPVEQTPQRVAGARLLVIEDDSAVREFISTLLQEEGFSVTSADGSEAALELLNPDQTPPDLVLTDVVMRGMSGPDLVRQLRMRWPRLRVVYMSGYAQTNVVDLQELEPEEFIQKPFKPDELLRKLGAALSLNATRQTILVVEDDEALRELVAEWLIDAGYVVQQVEDGRRASIACRKQLPDLVITDLVMPNQEGLETIRDLRKQFPELPIVAMSGAFSGTMLNPAKHFGASAVLTKPLDPKVLLETARRLLRRGTTSGLTAMAVSHS